MFSKTSSSSRSSASIFPNKKMSVMFFFCRCFFFFFFTIMTHFVSGLVPNNSPHQNNHNNYHEMSSIKGENIASSSTTATEESSSSATEGSSSSSSSSTKSTGTNTSTKTGTSITVEFKDFWGTKLVKNDDDDNEESSSSSLPLPCVPTLDPCDGPLPPGASFVPATKFLNEYDPKRMGRVGLQINLPSLSSSSSTGNNNMFDPDEVVRQLQTCIDAGLPTFQLAPYDNNNDKNAGGNSAEALALIGRLRKETPNFVEMHWTHTLPLKLSNENVNYDSRRQDDSKTTAGSGERQVLDDIMFDPKSIRQQVLSIVEMTQADALDTLLVPYNANVHPNQHLEVLDALVELQREGFIRTVGLQNGIGVSSSSSNHRWPTELIKEAQSYGFPTDMFQEEGNLLQPPSSSSSSSSSGGSTVTSWTNPLCGEFLTDTILLQRQLQLQKRADVPTNWQYWNILESWANNKHSNHGNNRNDKENILSKAEIWKLFETNVLETLEFFARDKHNVPMSCISLRWALQQKQEKQQQEDKKRQKQEQERRRKNHIDTNHVPNKGKNSMGGGVSNVMVPIYLTGDDDYVSRHPLTGRTTIIGARNNGVMTLSRKLQELRKVFTFELDDDDLNDIEKHIVYHPKKHIQLQKDIPIEFLQQLQNIHGTTSTGQLPMEVLIDLELLEQGSNEDHFDDDNDEDDGYPPIDFSNQALWL